MNIHDEIKAQLNNFARITNTDPDTVILNEQDYIELEMELETHVVAPRVFKTYNGCSIIKSSDIKKGTVKVFRDYNNV